MIRMRQILPRASLVLVVVLALAFAGSPAQTSPSAPTPSRSRVTEEAFKNIQVLKGIPADQLFPAMQFITYSLGVECSFCHVEGSFDKDDKKPKQAARKMMQMMFTINRENFEGKREVTCYSCHRGHSHPQSTPVIAEAENPPLAASVREDDEHETVPPDVPSAERIFAKYAEAIGGSSAIASLSSRVEKGAIILGGKKLPIDIFTKVPGKRMTVIHLPNGDTITTYDGVSGWTAAPGRPVHDIPASEVASARLEADLQLPIQPNGLLNDLRAAGPEKIGDHDVYVVSGTIAGEPAAKLYFDEHSGLLVRLLRYVNSPLGRNPTQIDYADYRDTGGVKVPFQRTLARFGSRFTIEIDEVQNNVPVDNAKFLRPAAETSPPKE